MIFLVSTFCHWSVFIVGASSGTAELLPPPSSAANWTIGLPTDNGHDSDQVFEFNGTQAVKVPDGVVTVNLKEPFMISVWMRHGPGTKEKETILCNSDKTGLSVLQIFSLLGFACLFLYAGAAYVRNFFFFFKLGFS